MKRLLSLFLITAVLVSGAMLGTALAERPPGWQLHLLTDDDSDYADITNSGSLRVSSQGSGELTFNMNSVTNSSAKDFEELFTHFACEVTSRVGDDDILVTLQGSILTTSSAFANIGTNKTISNSTTTATNPSSLQFQDSGTGAQRIRLHVVSGAGLVNTIAGTCRPVR